MHDDDKPGRSSPAGSPGAQDPVEEAGGASFPASDPPAWTAARAGLPRSVEAPGALGQAGAAPPLHCEAVGLFASEPAAQAVAEALLGSGFNMVDIGPPRSRGNLGAGIGGRTPVNVAESIGFYAALGALAAGAVAALFMPRGARRLFAAAAGGAVGALSARTAARFAQHQGVEGEWPQDGTLLRVKVKTAEDQKRALAIIEGHGALKAHISWPRGA